LANTVSQGIPKIPYGGLSDQEALSGGGDANALVIVHESLS
jgi:hypothetical protein